MDTLNPDIRNFVERLGLAMERMGATRTFGRQFALLMVADEPLSLDQQAELLHVSKASISTNGRMLERSGLVQRVPVLGDRRNYYEILPGSFDRVFSAKVAGIDEIVKLTDVGLTAIDEKNHVARSRLEEMRALYTYLNDAMDVALVQWRKKQNKIKS